MRVIKVFVLGAVVLAMAGGPVNPCAAYYPHPWQRGSFFFYYWKTPLVLRSPVVPPRPVVPSISTPSKAAPSPKSPPKESRRAKPATPAHPSPKPAPAAPSATSPKRTPGTSPHHSHPAGIASGTNQPGHEPLPVGRYVTWEGEWVKYDLPHTGKRRLEKLLGWELLNQELLDWQLAWQMRFALGVQ